jgi:hypothetical protein
MDQLEQLKRENEKLAVDSVVLDKIIEVVDAWNMCGRRYPDLRMIEIAKIINERSDTTMPPYRDECAGKIEEAAFVRTFSPHEMTDDEINQQRIRMKPLTR